MRICYCFFFVLVLLVSGCGGGGGSGTSTDDSGQSPAGDPSQTPTDDPAPPTTDDTAPPTTDDTAPPTTDDTAPPPGDDTTPPPGDDTTPPSPDVSVLTPGEMPADSNFLAVDDSNQSGTEDGSSSHPYRTVQAALNAATSGDSIRIAAGVYRESIQINNKTLHLYGGFPGADTADYASGSGGTFSERNAISNETHLQGNGSGPVVLFINADASGSSIDGFRISGGEQGVVFDTEVTWPPLVDISISNNVIENNLNESGYGGGFFIEGSRITLRNNVIRNNRATRGGGVAGRVINLNMEHNHILDNDVSDDHGGGIFITGTGTIDSNLIKGNDVGTLAGYGWGGGIIVAGVAEDDNGDPVTTPLVLSNNRIEANHAETYGGGIFIDEGASAQIINNLVIKNTSGEGGAGIYVDGAGTSDSSDLRSTAVIENCTVADNLSAGYQGNGVMVQYADVSIKNSIFWGNGDDFTIVDDEHSSPGTLAVEYSLSFEAIAGSGNLQVDPQFAAAAAGDYHLKSSAGRWNVTTGQWVTDTASSPAIDAGNPGSDFSREPADNGERVNLGAFGNSNQASKSGGNPQVSSWWRPTPGVSWQWQLSGDLDQSFDVEMYDIDLMEVSTAEIASLKQAGRTVICYFSAGSWEDWREDISLIPAAVIGETMDGWPDERWLDISNIAALEPVMAGRLDLAVTKGCDGVEPDNVDGYQNASGFNLTASDQLAYNRWLAAQAHDRGLSIGLKNDLDQVAQLEPDFDWALNEQCFEMDECDKLLPFINANKAVFGVEYNLAVSAFCTQANALNFDWLSKDLDLDAPLVSCR